MATFDFITDEQLRASLQADYSELNACMECEAWKAVHVLAGSIIEALLIDTLRSGGCTKSDTELHQMDLCGMITEAMTLNAISKNASELSGVVRDYRNLIHPGRVIRLKQKVNKNGATIARTLVDMIVDEVAEQRKNTYGYTAEQIVAKILSDSSSLLILGHILKGTNERELPRLLLSAIPDQYNFLCTVKSASASDIHHKRALSSLETCYRAAFQMVNEQTKRQVTKKFVTILMEESESVVFTFETAFFRASDLRYLCENDQILVKQHILGRMKHGTIPLLKETLTGIGRFLNSTDTNTWLDPLVRRLVHDKDDEDPFDEVGDYICNEVSQVPPAVEVLVSKRLIQWRELYESNGNTSYAGYIQELMNRISDMNESDPFADE